MLLSLSTSKAGGALAAAAALVSALLWAAPRPVRTRIRCRRTRRRRSPPTCCPPCRSTAWCGRRSSSATGSTRPGSSPRPARPGAAPGTNQTPRSNILAYNLTTGALHHLVGAVAQRAGPGASPPRRTARGSTSAVTSPPSAASPATGIAALDATTGARGHRRSTRSLNARVRSIAPAARRSTSAACSPPPAASARSRLAAFAAANGALIAWNPGASAEVFAVVAPAGRGRVVAGGRFTTLGGAAAYGMGAVDATTGAAIAWPANQVVRNAGPNAAIWSLVDQRHPRLRRRLHVPGGGGSEDAATSRARSRPTSRTGALTGSPAAAVTPTARPRSAASSTASATRTTAARSAATRRPTRGPSSAPWAQTIGRRARTTRSTSAARSTAGRRRRCCTGCRRSTSAASPARARRVVGRGQQPVRRPRRRVPARERHRASRAWPGSRCAAIAPNGRARRAPPSSSRPCWRWRRAACASRGRRPGTGTTGA